MLRSGCFIGSLAALGLVACSIPNTAFHASPDGGGDDDVSGVLAIRASVASFDVDEGSTTDFTVRLTQAPSAELVVRVAPADAAAALKIGISAPELRFEPTNFDQPQAITVTGLADVDAADALAGIALTASGVDPITVNATVRDHDKVEIATDITSSGVLTVNETKSSAVHVHLTHQPAADVRVKVMLGTGPVTVSPSEVTFTAANYAADQTFMFTAPDDVNIISEDESLTFQATGLADKLYTIHDVDKDTLNINVTPSTLSVNEGGSSQLTITLTKQPAMNTTVHLALQTGNVTLSGTDLVFTPQDYDHAQTVTVSAPQDQNTSNEQDQITLSIPALPGVGSVSIGVNTIDDDTQAILEDAPDPLSVTENQTVKFGVTLKFQPSSDITVAVSSLSGNVASASPGTLTFTSTNYNMAALHQVTVQGTDDNNLATDSTSIKLHEATLVDKLVPVNVADDDKQQIVVSTTSLSIPEGMPRTFDVSLKFDPGTTVTVNLDETPMQAQMALPLDKTQLTFTSANYATTQQVKVSPPVDNNNVSETATVTLTGASAPSPATVMLTVADGTVVQTWGFPTQFPGTFQIPAGFVFAYQINVGAVANLNQFHTFLPAAAGTYTMALYTDAGGVPGSLVPNGAMILPKVAATGVNDSDPLATPPQLNAPTYWLAIRFSQMNAIGYASGQTGKQCLRNVNLDIGVPWPATFMSATCTTDNLFNLWITTFHQ
jgi:hypothetical protein